MTNSPQLPPLPEWGSYPKYKKLKMKKEKQRNQVKSRFYYIFWGAATLSVLFGQLYVGSGYRSYARSLNRIFDTVEVEVNRPKFY
tara:strand:+ start:703 stop:957 length:255 start_codon:yes stop_codon:yes gene_type:complete